MKNLLTKINAPRPRNIMVLLINALLFLVDLPCDFSDWVLKLVELVLFLSLLTASGKLRFPALLSSHFQ